MAIYTHPSCIDHFPGAGHPESPDRLRAVLAALDDARFIDIPRREAPQATREQLVRAHDAALVDSLVASAPASGYLRIDADTVMSPGSLEAALRAAGAACAAIDAVVAAGARKDRDDAHVERRAFCAVRPPGHHATRDTAMGFCLFNAVAVGAAHALAAYGLTRVAIVDFDVHHGNGTQDIFWSEPRVMYVSSHQSPLYPGTGASDETGAGNIVNVPLPPASGTAQFRHAYERGVFPALRAFRPQLVMISAGFDAHKLDPLANLDLESADYAWVTKELVAIADEFADGRVVSMLEGGYSLTALREGTAAHCGALFGV